MSNTLNVSAMLSGYAGAIGGLTIEPTTGTAWLILGGSVIDTAIVSGSVSSDTSGNVVTENLTLSDAAHDASVSLSLGVGGIVTGTVTQISSGQTVATFTVDQSGNGTIRYSNGTTATIAGWQTTG